MIYKISFIEQKKIWKKISKKYFWKSQTIYFLTCSGKEKWLRSVLYLARKILLVLDLVRILREWEVRNNRKLRRRSEYISAFLEGKLRTAALWKSDEERSCWIIALLIPEKKVCRCKVRFLYSLINFPAITWEKIRAFALFDSCSFMSVFWWGQW